MINKVLVALDGSARTQHVFDTALEIATRYGATLIPFRAIAIPPDFPPAAHQYTPDLLPAFLRNEALAMVSQLTAKVVATVNVAPPVIGESESPWRAILAAAEECDVDLIVLGSHGYRGFDHVLGTTAGNVANRSPRDVYVVHEVTRGSGGPMATLPQT